jgi:hypothetical protein
MLDGALAAAGSDDLALKPEILTVRGKLCPVDCELLLRQAES